MVDIFFDLHRLSHEQFESLVNAFQQSYKFAEIEISIAQLDIVSQVTNTTKYLSYTEDGIQSHDTKTSTTFPEILNLSYTTYSKSLSHLKINGVISETGTALIEAFPELATQIETQKRIREHEPLCSVDCAIVTKSFDGVPQFFVGAVYQAGKVIANSAFELEAIFQALGFGNLHLIFNTQLKSVNRHFKKKVEKKFFPKTDVEYAKLMFYATDTTVTFRETSNLINLLYKISAELFRLRNIAELNSRLEASSGIFKGLTVSNLQRSLLTTQCSLAKAMPEILYSKAVDFFYAQAQQDADEGDVVFIDLLTRVSASPTEFTQHILALTR